MDWTSAFGSHENRSTSDKDASIKLCDFGMTRPLVQGQVSLSCLCLFFGSPLQEVFLLGVSFGSLFVSKRVYVYIKRECV